MKPCVDPTCRRARDEVTRYPTPVEVWPAVEHCMCGQHTRSMTREQFIRILTSRPK